MEKLFKELIGTTIERDGKTWHLAGYNDAHFIVARNTRKAFLKKDILPTYLLPEYDVYECRYEYASESELINGY